jgi:hypothetical protein
VRIMSEAQMERRKHQNNISPKKIPEG